MAIKILYPSGDDIVVDDLEDAVEDIIDRLTDYEEKPITIFEIATGISYKCHWSVTLRQTGK